MSHLTPSPGQSKFMQIIWDCWHDMAIQSHLPPLEIHRRELWQRRSATCLKSWNSEVLKLRGQESGHCSATTMQNVKRHLSEMFFCSTIVSLIHRNSWVRQVESAARSSCQVEATLSLRCSLFTAEACMAMAESGPGRMGTFPSEGPRKITWIRKTWNSPRHGEHNFSIDFMGRMKETKHVHQKTVI